MDNILITNEFERQYLDSYHESNTSATNPEHQLPSNKEVESGQSLTPSSSSSEAAKVLARQVMPKNLERIELFGHPIEDYVSELLPNGAPEGSRHMYALSPHCRGAQCN